MPDLPDSLDADQMAILTEGLCPLCRKTDGRDIVLRDDHGTWFCPRCGVGFKIHNCTYNEYLEETMKKRKTGGWPKGMPRKAKTPEQEALLDLWDKAQQAGVAIHSVEELLKWAASAGVPIPVLPPLPSGKKPKPTPTETAKAPRKMPRFPSPQKCDCPDCQAEGERELIRTFLTNMMVNIGGILKVMAVHDHEG